MKSRKVIDNKGLISLWGSAIFLWGLAACSGQWHYHRQTKLPDLVGEASGMLIQGDTCWLHNDSGGNPTLYGFNEKGELLDSMRIPGAKNVDWEALAHDPAGNLYLCDIGNNRNRRQDLKIYRWRPGQKVASEIAFRYPDQQTFPPPDERKNYDAEGCFWWNDSLYVFSKNRNNQQDYYTRLYAIPARPGTYIATLKDSLNLDDRIVTGAAIRPDGKEVALMTYQYRPDKFMPLKASVFLLQDFPGTQFCQASQIYRKEVPPIQISRQFEAIDYYRWNILWLATEASPINAPFIARLKLR